VQDNPKPDVAFDEYKLWSEPAAMTIYSHRRPVAMFDIGFTGINENGCYISKATNNSYDLDHESEPSKGIVTSVWRWKNVKDNNWSSGTLPTAWEPNETFMISLVVTDLEGTESYPYVITVKTDPGNLKPVIDCVPTYSNWTKDNVNIKITATDLTPDLKCIKYATTNSTGMPASWSTPINASDPSHLEFNITLSSTNVHYVHMMAFDEKGNSTYNFRGPYYIDKIAPEIDCVPASMEADGTDITVVINAGDSNSGLASAEYKWTKTTDIPTSGWVPLNPPRGAGSYSANVTLTDDGIYYLYMKATDVAGNEFVRYRGTFTRSSLGISYVSIKGYWNHWRGQTDIFGKVMSNEPHRFLSYKTIKIETYTEGDPDYVTIRLSPALEAMYYTDPFGNVYSYEDDVGYTETFPLIMNKVEPNKYTRDYVLPLAKSTKSPDDVRLGPPYWIVVTAVKGDKSVSYVIDDIDITGNIFDHTYIQPIN